MRKKKKFFINGIVLTSTSIITRFTVLVFNIYISNRVGSEAVGIFSLVMSIYMFFMTIANSGLNIAITNLVSEKFARNKKDLAFKTIRTGIFFGLLLGLLAGGLIIFLAPYLVSNFLYNQVSTRTFYYIAIGLPFIAMSFCIHGYFAAVRRAYKTAISQILELIVKVSATILLLQIAIPKGIEAICIALILSDVISEVVSFIYIYISYLLDKRKRYNMPIQGFRQKKGIIQIAFPVAITSYVRSALSTVKQLLIPGQLEKSGLSTSASLSNYGIITGMVLPILLFCNVFIASFSGLLIPEISTYLAQNNKKAITFVCNRIFKITATFSVLIASVFLLFSNEISLAIYNNHESAYFLTILAPLIFFMYIDNIIDSILKGLNKQFSVMCCNVFELVVDIVLIYILVPIFGVYGYLTSIFFCEILNFVISTIQLVGAINLKIKLVDWVIKPVFCACISYIILQFLPLTFTNAIFELIISILIFSGMYYGCNFLLQRISKRFVVYKV